MSYMFYECSSLYSIPNIFIWDTRSLTNISHMFSNCSSLPYIKHISQWNITKVIDMSEIFNYLIVVQT